jgi:chloramphenicol O-acetyltransferase type B
MSIIKTAKKLRNLYLSKIKWSAYDIGDDFHAGIRVRLWARRKLQIGRNFYIGRDSFIETDCIIGDHVMLGNKVGIVGKYDHIYNQVGVPTKCTLSIRDESYAWKGLDLITIIGNDVWIGYGATIIQGITIGEGSIIAAGSVVTKNVDAYSIYGGNPARKLSNRFDSDDDQASHSLAIKDYKII